MTSTRPRDQRGGSSSVLAAIVAPMLLVLAGLVVDGGGQLAAAREAQAVAAEAARAGVDAAGPENLGAQFSPVLAQQGAQEYLEQAGVAGTVSVVDGRVTVRTTITYQTIFVGIVGIHSLDGHGESSARRIRNAPR